MNTSIRNLVAVVPLVVATATILAFGQNAPIVDSATTINSANELVRSGDVDKAIETYQTVTPSDPNREHLNYNLAVAQYRKGDIENSSSAFNDLAAASDTKIAANSRYNLGNCNYAKALSVAEQDSQATIELLREAISNYRSSLKLDATQSDARANIELAAELIRQLEETQKKKEQQQNQKQNEEQENDQEQQQENQDQQNDDSESDSQQEQKQEKSDSADSNEESSDESQGSDDPSKPDKNNQDEANDQEGKGDKPNDQSEQQENTGEKNDQSATEQSDSQNQNEPVEQASSDQQRDSEQQSPQRTQSQNKQEDMAEQSNANEASPEQAADNKKPIPTGELTTADEQDTDQKQNGTALRVDPNAKNGLMTKEEALKMLQSVRDRDMLRRLQQQQRERARQVPVDRDW